MGAWQVFREYFPHCTAKVWFWNAKSSDAIRHIVVLRLTAAAWYQRERVGSSIMAASKTSSYTFRAWPRFWGLSWYGKVWHQNIPLLYCNLSPEAFIPVTSSDFHPTVLSVKVRKHFLRLCQAVKRVSSGTAPVRWVTWKSRLLVVNHVSVHPLTPDMGPTTTRAGECHGFLLLFVSQGLLTWSSLKECTTFQLMNVSMNNFYWKSAPTLRHHQRLAPKLG